MKGFIFIVSLILGAAIACTNLLVTPEASEEGSMISYAADSHSLYGGLYHNKATNYSQGEFVNITDWDSGVPLGYIPQVEHTYNVVGNTNEWGLAIGETTFGGLESLQHQSKKDDKTAILDYGSMIYLALQRAKTATEAIKVMTDLVEEYGYYSQGESFSIADPKEVWVLEMIGKGEYELGAVWVARRVPPGHVTAHANQARITTFPRDDPDNCVFHPDVVKFAKDHGFYPKDASEEDFSFSDVYAPLNFELVHGCEMRVWSFFRSVVGAEELDKYQDYVTGRNYKNRMPWSYEPKQKLNHRRMMELMKDHFENTPFEFESDVGAGPFNAPYRWRPMDFEVDGHSYANRRSASTQQTAWVFVAQIRPDMSYPFQMMNWFGVDDAANTVFMPMYGAMTRVPECLALDGKAGIMDFSIDSAFWVFNLVSQMAYDRWRIIHPNITDKATYFQDQFDRTVAEKDEELKGLLEQGKLDEAVEKATSFSFATAEDVFHTWRDFWRFLFAAYVDGLYKEADPGEVFPHVSAPGYGDIWYQRIVNETGDKYLAYDNPSTDNNAW